MEINHLKKKSRRSWNVLYLWWRNSGFWWPAEDMHLKGATNVTQMRCSVMISVHVECIYFSPKKNRVELCITCWSRMWQPYIENSTALSDICIHRVFQTVCVCVCVGGGGVGGVCLPNNWKWEAIIIGWLEGEIFHLRLTVGGIYRSQEWYCPTWGIAVMDLLSL